MKEYDATEVAHKNGYARGVKDFAKEVISYAEDVVVFCDVYEEHDFIEFVKKLENELLGKNKPSEKEKLIEVIQGAVGGWLRDDIAERIADNLIKNGAVIKEGDT